MYGNVSDFLSTGCFMFADDTGSSVISQAKHKVDMSFDISLFFISAFQGIKKHNINQKYMLYCVNS